MTWLTQFMLVNCQKRHFKCLPIVTIFNLNVSYLINSNVHTCNHPKCVKYTQCRVYKQSIKHFELKSTFKINTCISYTTVTINISERSYYTCQCRSSWPYRNIYHAIQLSTLCTVTFYNTRVVQLIVYIYSQLCVYFSLEKHFFLGIMPYYHTKLCHFFLP